ADSLIRPLQELLLPAAAAVGHAKTGGNRYAPAPQDQWLAGDRLPQLLRPLAGDGFISAGQQDTELIATIATDHVTGSRLIGENRRHDSQGLVGDRLTVTFVDRAKPVQVDHDTSQRLIVPNRFGPFPPQMLLKRAAVQKRGQRIGATARPARAERGGTLPQLHG